MKKISFLLLALFVASCMATLMVTGTSPPATSPSSTTSCWEINSTQSFGRGSLVPTI